MATWREDIVTKLESLGGVGSLSEIHAALENIRGPLRGAWKASVQGPLEAHSSDSQAFRGTEDAFYSVDGIGEVKRGLR